jgi:hypothetical protein
MTQYLDFNESYSPIGSIDSVRLILALSATLCLTLHVLDISNAFQNSIIFDPDERVYLSLPPFFLDWFHPQWPDYNLPSQDPTKLAIQCLKSIQGTCDYFLDVPSASIPKTPYPFPIEASFEQLLYESPPLVGRKLQLKEKDFRLSFNHLVGALMHVAGISRPGIAYACMRFSGYMATPNAPIFDALHQTFCYLYHHPHLPIMYPSK